MKKSTLRRRTVATRLTAVLAAGGLVLGAAACSDSDDDAADTSTAASATESQAEETTDEAEDEVDSVDDLPEEMQQILEQEGGEDGALGAFQSFERDGDNALATFEHGYIAQSPDAGAQPVKGMIGQTWAEDGALQNPIGMPTAPEKGDEVDGWDQSFENGVLGWHPDESGNFAATKESRDEAANDKAEDAIGGAVDDAKDAAEDAKDRAGDALDGLKGDN